MSQLDHLASPPERIETARLVLRPPTKRDAPVITEALGNYGVAQFLTPVQHPYTLSLAHQWLRTMPAAPVPGDATFMVELAGKGPIGCVALNKELGFWIAQPFWGQGFVTEAARALLGWHFAHSDAASVPCSAHYNNRASLAVQKKLGFTRTGISQRFSAAQNRLVEHIETTLTRGAFEARK